jgi:imidazole glycerol-phosphate synthase subunit HisH
MSTPIGIIDYGMGNLRSVQKAFEKNGDSAEIFSDPNQMKDYKKLVLPGVGGFGDAMEELNRRQLADAIRDWAAADKPLLGICLGLQLLFSVSHEDGDHHGLGLLDGDVVRFDLSSDFKVPHMGWNQVQRQEDFNSFETIRHDDYFYFVHSFYVRPADRSIIALTSCYEHDFCAAIQQGNLLATQFHPEKSQRVGLRLLREFAAAPY